MQDQVMLYRTISQRNIPHVKYVEIYFSIAYDIKSYDNSPPVLGRIKTLWKC